MMLRAMAVCTILAVALAAPEIAGEDDEDDVLDDDEGSSSSSEGQGVVPAAVAHPQSRSSRSARETAPPVSVSAAAAVVVATAVSAAVAAAVVVATAVSVAVVATAVSVKGPRAPDARPSALPVFLRPVCPRTHPVRRPRPDSMCRMMPRTILGGLRCACTP